MDKLRNAQRVMNLDLLTMLIDNVHRLPAESKPRPLIVKFCSFLDKDAVWANRRLLANAIYKISLREHFNMETEENIRVLLPIRQAALQQKPKLNVTMISDKVYINNQLFTVKNLHHQHEHLKLEMLALKEIENYIFFYSAASPLSSFKETPFNLNGNTYINSEQYVQEQKALLAKAPEIAKQSHGSKTSRYDEKPH